MQIAEEIIKSIDLDITAYENYLKEVSDLMLSQKISNYPHFCFTPRRAGTVR